ncbi:MAG: hypothetical protein QOF02_1851 [Blastocatellia bacterium]|jgi:hypothetical protein|nr:hypothetical protein [Blastocatellia bacterium]
MSTVAGIFNSRSDAERAAANLGSAGFAPNNISLLSPGMTDAAVDAHVPTTETEQPGMGSAMGGVVGGAMGAAGGATIGAAAASLLVPGVGPVIAAGIIGAALLGAGGATLGAATGGAMEDEIAPELPHDELFVYEDALRQGKSVVIGVTDDETQAEGARTVLAQAGAESIDAARDSWWVGLRDAEQEEYAEQGKDFETDEAHYRSGFEAALHPQRRGKSFDDANESLRQRYKEECDRDAFRCGYERGQAYQQSLREKDKS